MNKALIETLQALPTDSSRVVDLYSQLYGGSYLVPVQAGSETSLETALFLIYPTPDGIRELPIFTSRDYVLNNLPDNALFTTVRGADLWPRLLDVVKSTGNCEVAVDPGQSHGIRLSVSMILGMISSYGKLKE